MKALLGCQETKLVAAAAAAAAAAVEKRYNLFLNLVPL